MSNEPEKPRGLLGRLFAGKKDAQPAPPPMQSPGNRLSDELTSASVDPAAVREAGTEQTSPSVTPAATKKAGWFQRLKDGLNKTSARLTEGITSVFTKRRLDEETLEELEDLLLQADLGVETASRITASLAKNRYGKEIAVDEVRAVLASEVERVLTPVAMPLEIDATHKPEVILVVGVNGTGKTTTIGKLASRFRSEGKSIMLAAGDTFRAAAVDQLKVWGERTGAKVVTRPVGADASGLAFDALKEAKASDTDVIMIDTAGRLQNKHALMEELEKVVRVIRKIDATAPHQVLLVLDATTGQNALNQVEVFKDRAGVTGLIMTKLDGTARGGILVAISAKFNLPVHAIGVGEGIDDLQAFDAREFARAIAMR
jgi:fused signal recognition particle receptor